jgi:mono/diheme cytochrome c family protein
MDFIRITSRRQHVIWTVLLLFASLHLMAQDAQQSTDRISFAKEVAPVLRQHCHGCHIAGQQASGGLRMDTFAQLMQGGDSGAIINPSNSDDSLLSGKLTGQASGQRMPAGGRAPLSKQKIDLIAAWIRQGARFDGPSQDMNIQTLIDQAWASEASHNDLMNKRIERAQINWKLAMPDQQPEEARSEDFYLIGNVPQARLIAILQQLQKATAFVSKQLAAPSDQPLIRGGLVVYVLRSRYDYSEFGRMQEKRELPRGWVGHWSADAAQAYGVLLDEQSKMSHLPAVMVQILTGAYLGSHIEVPVWFAEGIARNLVLNQFRKNDPRVASWQQAIQEVVSSVPDAKSLIAGQLDEETLGVAGLAITQPILSRKNRQQFNKLLTQLRTGKPFPQAMKSTFGEPELLIKNWLSK